MENSSFAGASGACPAPGGAFAPAKFLDPAPGGAFAPAKFFDPAPGGAFAPAKFVDPAPGGAFAPAKFFDPAPGGGRPRRGRGLAGAYPGPRNSLLIRINKSYKNRGFSGGCIFKKGGHFQKSSRYIRDRRGLRPAGGGA